MQIYFFNIYYVFMSSKNKIIKGTVVEKKTLFEEQKFQYAQTYSRIVLTYSRLLVP